MIESYIKAITEIANHKRVKEELEPNLMWHEAIKESQTRRVLYAMRLFEDELYKDSRGTIQKT
jgi:hypothetical protein